MSLLCDHSCKILLRSNVKKTTVDTVPDTYKNKGAGTKMDKCLVGWAV